MLGASALVALLAHPMPQESRRAPATRSELTLAEATAWARSLEASLARGDRAPLDAALDQVAIVDRAAAGTDVSAGYLFGVRLAARTKLSDMVSPFPRTIENGGSIALLGVRSEAGDLRATFRLLATGGGLEYAELCLARRASGAVRIVDVREFSVGLTLSEKLRIERFGRFRTSDATGDFKALAVAKKIDELATAGKRAEALAAFEELPEQARTERDYLLMRIGIARGLDLAAYRGAVEAMRRIDPGNPCFGVVSIPFHQRAGEHQEALAAIDALDRVLGGDPYLDVLRATSLSAKGDVAAAKLALARAAEALPSEPRVHRARLEIALAEQDFAGVARILDRERELGLVVPDPCRAPELAAFAASPAGRAWIAAREQRLARLGAAAKDFGERLEAESTAGNAKFVRDALDVGRMLDRALAGLDRPRGALRAFRNGLRDSIDPGAAMAKGARLHLLRVHFVAGVPHALLRQLAQDGGFFQYLDIELDEVAGRVVAADLRIFPLGERLSATARRGAERHIPQAERAAPSDEARLWVELTEAAQKDPTAALEKFARLPEHMRREPAAMLIRLRCASSLSDEQYREALAEFRRTCPDNPSADMLAIDGWLARKNPREALSAIERLDEVVRDPYLEVLAATAWHLAAEPAKVKAALHSAIAREPGLAPAYCALLEIVRGERDWAETRRTLQGLEERCGLQLPDDLGELEPYREFAKSAEYREWQAQRHARHEGPASRK